MTPRTPRTLVDILRARADERPEAPAYTFLEGDLEPDRSISYGGLLSRALAIADRLDDRGAASPPPRALLLYPPGIDYIEAFLACLAAGVIAVPAYPPDPARLSAALPRLRAVAADADISIVLTTAAIESFGRLLLPTAPELSGARWIATDTIDNVSQPRGGGRLSEGGGEAIALLQYTSGSTAAPKGVMVSHQNLLSNLYDLERAEPNDAATVSLSWLPAYHDMGLIEGILHPLYGGYPAYLMAPSAFLERPLRWLRAITSLRVTNSGGPNFAYDLCARKVTDDELSTLDLSTWRVAYNGAEPVRADTLRRFLSVFGPRGLRASAFYPVYGLAEATLLVTTGGPEDEPRFEAFNAGLLRAGVASAPSGDEPASELVACGEAPPGTRVVIVDPEQNTAKADGEIGEIWIAGPGVAGGYWGRAAETERVFRASLAGTGEGPFLRSGDTGFLRGGRLYITGRIKDCIVIRGESHAAHDVELTAERSLRAARPGCGAAFSVSGPFGEAAAVVVEVNPALFLGADQGAAMDEAMLAIRGAVAERHGIALSAVALAAPRSVPKTSSGKVRRAACREAFLSGELSILAKWALSEALAGSADATAGGAATGGVASGEAGAILAWIRGAIAARSGVPLSMVDPAGGLSRYGLDSLAAVEIVTDASVRFGGREQAALLLEMPSIEAIASLLAGARAPTAGNSIGFLDNSTDGARRRSAALEARLIAADINGLFDVDLEAAEPPSEAGPLRSILLTGATGFLGGYLLRELLDQTRARVVCLARGGRARLVGALRARGLLRDNDEARVDVIEGDLREARLGLAPALATRLSLEIDAIYHGAAAVNWVYSYEGLRDVNVLGTAELLRLAARGRRKAFHFVSTLGVCHFIDAPALSLSEEDDVTPLLPWMRLGYIKTKAVAEALVQEARARGLTAFIYRPSFVVGDGASGASNTDDFLCSLIKGCVQMGSAPDLDWGIDACPVDHAARAIVALSTLAAEPSPERARRGSNVAHITGRAPRPLRELVLWMNALGYPVELKPYLVWLEELKRSAVNSSHALYSLRSFFERRPLGAGEPESSLAELYEDARRPAVDSSRTRGALADLGLVSPALDARLLDLIFHALVQVRFLDAPREPPRRAPRRASRGPRSDEAPIDAQTLQGALRRGLDDPSLTIHAARAEPRRSEHSIMSELTSLWYDRPTGLFDVEIDYSSDRRDATPTRARLAAILKVKPPDEVVLDIGRSVAGSAGPSVLRAYDAVRGSLPARGCHLRELAVYSERDPRLRQRTPGVYGVLRDDERGLFAVALESIDGFPLLNSADDASGWGRGSIEAAVRGLAEIHAVYYGRERELFAAPDLAGASLATMEGALSMRPLWRALAEYAGPLFAPFYGEEGRAAHAALADEVERWWPPLAALPRTLIHNDFNPRNVALRPPSSPGAGQQLCAYDWELAAIGAPQRDLAELLCFVLTQGAPAEEARRYGELHRAELSRATGASIDEEPYWIGFRSALAELCVDRLAMYAMIHAARRQRFLPRVIAAWWRLYSSLCLDRPSGGR